MDRILSLLVLPCGPGKPSNPRGPMGPGIPNRKREKLNLTKNNLYVQCLK